VTTTADSDDVGKANISVLLYSILNIIIIIYLPNMIIIILYNVVDL